MKKLLPLTLTFIAALTVNARQLTPAEALTRAFGEKATTYSAPSRSDGFNLVYTSTDNSSGDNGVYIFNRPASAGFLIVSADDTAPAILGYADAGYFNPAEIPANMRAWLDEYTSQIAWASSNTSAPSRATSDSRPYRDPISPLCATNWNQGSPYNNMCPLYNGSRCVTGCVATAMAQVMKYHNYPTTGTGSHTYNATAINQTLTFDFSATTFDWDNMLNTYSSSATQAQNDAVATLMYAAGISVDMGYTPSSSGANSGNIGPAMIDYFGYDKCITEQRREWYGLYDWEDLIYNDLATCGPVIYGGQSGTGGHQFVCDGYDSDGYFHINWGWGGLSDGYFLLTALTPASQGTGGSSGGYNFDQSALIGTKPAQADSHYTLLMEIGDVLNASVSNKNITIQGGFTNRSYVALTDLYLGLEINGTYYPWIYGPTASLGSNYGFNSYIVSLSDLPEGNYVARPVFKATDCDWSHMKSNISNVSSLNINVATDGTISVSQPAEAAITVSDFKLDTPLSQNKNFSVSATVTNNSDSEYANSVNLLLKNSTNTYKISMYALDLMPGESADISFQSGISSQISTGDYELCLAELDGNSVKNIIASIPVTVDEYVTPGLTLKSFSISDSQAVQPDDLKVNLTFGNTGGYYFGTLQVVIFPYIPGQSVSSIASISTPYFMIPANVSDHLITLSLLFPEGEAGKEYFAKIYNGNTSISNNVTFKITNTTGIDDISSSDSDITFIEVYNVNGIKIASGTDISVTDTLPAGLYITVSTHTDGQRITQKFIKK